MPADKLWNRPYLTALGANFLAYFGVQSFVLYPLLVKAEGGSDTDVGIVMGAFSLTSVLVRPLAGLLADRASARAVALLGLAILAAVLPCFAWVQPGGNLVVALRAAHGVGWACAITPLMTLATQLTPSERLAESLGVYGISGLAAHALAPLVGEWLLAARGFGALLALDLALALLAIALVATIPRPAVLQGATANSAAAQPGGGVLRLALLGALLLALVHGSVRGVTVNFIAPYCYWLGFERVGPFFVAFTVAALLTRFKLAALPDRFGERRVAVPSALLIGANCLLLSQVGSLPLLVLVGVLGGLGQGLMFPSISALFVRLLGEGRRALALALYATCFELGFGLGLPLYGLLADALGYRWMFAAGGVLVAATGLLFALLVPAQPPRARSGRGRSAAGDP